MDISNMEKYDAALSQVDVRKFCLVNNYRIIATFLLTINKQYAILKIGFIYGVNYEEYIYVPSDWHVV